MRLLVLLILLTLVSCGGAAPDKWYWAESYSHFASTHCSDNHADKINRTKSDHGYVLTCEWIVE